MFFSKGNSETISLYIYFIISTYFTHQIPLFNGSGCFMITGMQSFINLLYMSIYIANPTLKSVKVTAQFKIWDI